MFNVIRDIQPLPNIVSVASINDFENFIDRLEAENLYSFKVATTTASAIGLPQRYGFLMCYIYSTQGALIEYKSLTPGDNLFRLRKYQGAWDADWTEIKTDTI